MHVGGTLQPERIEGQLVLGVELVDVQGAAERVWVPGAAA